MCTKDPNPPSGASNQVILNTTTVSSITGNSAICSGTISSDGGSPITSRGVCWSTSRSPTINNTKTTNGSGLGNFTSNLSLLSPNTTYYVRVYATNVYGTVYGSEITFKTLAINCAITGSTTGTMYSMQSPALGSIFYAGNSYAITMFSTVYTFGQANEVALYLNETKVYSFGTYLLFNNSPGNTRTFNFPSGLTPFPCYTIRVTKTENSKNVVYVTPKFEIK